MGVVHRAFDMALRRPVALKMLLNANGAGYGAVERFRREATAAASLRHPGIVQVHEIGEHEGSPFIVLELVEGESFEALLERSPLSPRRVAEIVRGIALALAHAHAQGVIHRDVKPGNVLIDREGAPRLMDFGLARNALISEKLTRAGQMIGTPAYMAPEQVVGDGTKQGPQTDVYGLGAVLYRALAGRPPFEASTLDALACRIVAEDALPLRKLDARVHADLETIALRCLEKEPARRYSSAAAVAEDLRRFLDGEPIRARPIGGIERALRIARKNRLAVALALALVVVAAAVPTALTLTRRTRANGALDDAVARLASFDEVASRSDIELKGESSQILLEGAGILVDAQSAALVISSSESNERVVRVDLVVVRHALRYSEHGLAAYALMDAERRLPSATDAERTAWEKLYGTTRDRVRVTRAFEAGTVRQLEGDLTEAERDFSQAIEIEPGYVLAWVARGNLRYRKDDLKGALGDLQRAVELEPTWAGARASLAQALNDAGEPARALEEAERAVALTRTGSTLFVRAQMRALHNDRERAIEDLDESLRVDPRGPAAPLARKLRAELGNAPK
jgi:tetratricopeptide (TPR) repeat protein